MRDEDKTVDGQSFHNEALTGSGIIREDGTYGPSVPDPTVLRGGPAGERTTSGGVVRPHPEDLTPVAQLPSAEKAEIESGGKTPFTRKASSK